MRSRTGGFSCGWMFIETSYLGRPKTTTNPFRDGRWAAIWKRVRRVRRAREETNSKGDQADSAQSRRRSCGKSGDRPTTSGELLETVRALQHLTDLGLPVGIARGAVAGDTGNVTVQVALESHAKHRPPVLSGRIRLAGFALPRRALPRLDRSCNLPTPRASLPRFPRVAAGRRPDFGY